MSRTPVLAAIVASVCLSGCSLPQLPTSDTLAVGDIVDAVECELKLALGELNPRYPFLSAWGVGLGLTLIANETGNFSPDLSQVFPASFGTATLGVHADFNATAKRTVNFKLAFAFRDLVQFQCPDTRAGGLHPLTSRLGIYEWLDRALAAIDKQDVVGDPLSIGTTLQFTMTAGGRISPQFVLVRSRSTPSSVFGATRNDDHTLDLALSPLPKQPAAPKPVEVIIVGQRQ